MSGKNSTKRDQFYDLLTNWFVYWLNGALFISVTTDNDAADEYWRTYLVASLVSSIPLFIKLFGLEQVQDFFSKFIKKDEEKRLLIETEQKSLQQFIIDNHHKLETILGLKNLDTLILGINISLMPLLFNQGSEAQEQSAKIEQAWSDLDSMVKIAIVLPTLLSITLIAILNEYLKYKEIKSIPAKILNAFNFCFDVVMAFGSGFAFTLFAGQVFAASNVPLSLNLERNIAVGFGTVLSFATLILRLKENFFEKSNFITNALVKGVLAATTLVMVLSIVGRLAIYGTLEFNIDLLDAFAERINTNNSYFLGMLSNNLLMLFLPLGEHLFKKFMDIEKDNQVGSKFLSQILFGNMLGYFWYDLQNNDSENINWLQFSTLLTIGSVLGLSKVIVDLFDPQKSTVIEYTQKILDGTFKSMAQAMFSLMALKSWFNFGALPNAVMVLAFEFYAALELTKYSEKLFMLSRFGDLLGNFFAGDVFVQANRLLLQQAGMPISMFWDIIGGIVRMGSNGANQLYQDAIETNVQVENQSNYQKFAGGFKNHIDNASGFFAKCTPIKKTYDLVTNNLEYDSDQVTSRAYLYGKLFDVFNAKDNITTGKSLLWFATLISGIRFKDKVSESEINSILYEPT